ncbi:MAG: MoaD/ThiS family protein [Sphingomonadales bacterium]|nr:MoaD/ThiS family protein [Sphingomonadales bacterium]
MAKVIPTAPFDSRYFGGAVELDVPAANLFALVRALDARAPGFALAVEEGGLLAVNGTAADDWSAPLSADAEVLIVPRIAGG